MKKVITYGTYDLLHYGHIRLLERAKELGDYLIVGVTSDDFDKRRGKINVSQSLMERVQAVKETGLADEIIIEEYEGQKIDDIIKYGADIFTVGSDWKGKFDYLKEYCEVVYLPRTEGISSSMIRSKNNEIRLGFVGNPKYFYKLANESNYVNGVNVSAIFCENNDDLSLLSSIKRYNNYDEFLDNVDAVYYISCPKNHYLQIKKALMCKKHVMCEAPICLSVEECKELYSFASKQKCILMQAIKTAHSTAYKRLILLLLSGVIGDIVSIDSTCTSLHSDDYFLKSNLESEWNSICSWGPTAMLPIFNILGTEYKKKIITSMQIMPNYDIYTKIDFYYSNATASIKVGKGVKSEGELLITGTKGYVYVPAPWWKTDYFEVRYEDQTENKRYFYSLDGEGLRYELFDFIKRISSGNYGEYKIDDISMAICNVVQDFYSNKDVYLLDKWSNK